MRRKHCCIDEASNGTAQVRAGGEERQGREGNGERTCQPPAPATQRPADCLACKHRSPNAR